MSDLLIDLLRANLVLGAAILLVMGLGASVRRRLGARSAYALWIVPPLAALGSLIPARTVILDAVAAAPAAPIEIGPPGAVQAFADAPLAAAAPSLDLGSLGLSVWALGVVVTLVFLATRQRRFVRALGRLTREADLFRADRAGVGPALVGLVRPRIVVPADFEARFSEAERAVVIAHEQAHLRAGDPWVNAIAALIQCLCWFNPLAHLAAWRLRLDQELACDATVMARFPRRPYAQAMLKTQGLSLTAPLACAWPSHPIKERIAMLKTATPSRSARFAGGALAAVLAAFAGVGAWAAQPPQIETVSSVARAHATTIADAPARVSPADRPDKASRRLGRDLVAALGRADHAEAIDLIDAGADVNHFTPGEGTPLIEAIRHDDMRAARRLIARGADVNQRAPGEGSALIVAAQQQKLQFVELLVAAGADVNGFVLGDETPLINASRSSDLRIVRFLVERGADPGLAVPTGNYPGQMRSPLSVSQDPAITVYLESRGARR